MSASNKLPAKEIQIRRANLDDADALTDLSIRSKQSNGYDDAFMANCREELTVTRECLTIGEYWIAETDDICGCACLDVDIDSRSAKVHAFLLTLIGSGKVLANSFGKKSSNVQKPKC
ncbi:MAG: hypothetical protein GKR95_24680 [Gammaproteobacteria bacterium]|nr:hypothetical protein [Gammaproteobacteria bacterium]